MDLTHMLEVNFYRDVTLNWAQLELKDQLSQVQSPAPYRENQEVLVEYIQNMFCHPTDRKTLIN